jgi:hypothetical protein
MEAAFRSSHRMKPPRIGTESGSRRLVAAMLPHCPVCDEPMKERGRAYQCGPCRQTIIFFAVSDTSPFIASCVAMAPNEKPQHESRGP